MKHFHGLHAFGNSSPEGLKFEPQNHQKSTPKRTKTHLNTPSASTRKQRAKKQQKQPSKHTPKSTPGWPKASPGLPEIGSKSVQNPSGDPRQAQTNMEPTFLHRHGVSCMSHARNPLPVQKSWLVGRLWALLGHPNLAPQNDPQR